MKNIYLIRHGQTDNNLNKILQGGRVDLSINDNGIKQADDFYESYKLIPFRKIYISKLKRSYESVKKFIQSGIPYEEYSELNEIDYGINDGHLSTEEPKSHYYEIIEDWKQGFVNKRMEGGESPIDVQNRLHFFLNTVLPREEDPILICMHGRAMRIFLATMMDYELKNMELFNHTNLTLYLLKYSNSICCIEKFNDTSHLKNVK